MKFRTGFALALLALFSGLATGLAIAQAPAPPFPPVTSIVNMPMDEEDWHEDVERVRRGLEYSLSPDEYKHALRTTGMANVLAGRTSLLVPGAKSTTSWSRLGPVGGFGNAGQNGRISGIQILDKPGGGYSVFAGSCQGGLWVTHSASWAVWTDIGTNLPNPSVRAFAVDPDNHDRIFVGTGDWDRYTGSGMYLTEDGGITWNQVNIPFTFTPEHFFRIFFLGNDPNPTLQKLVAVCDQGVIYSDDNGISWQLGEDPGGTKLYYIWTDLVVHPTDPSILYGFRYTKRADRDSGVFKSNDYGKTWTHLPDTDLPANAAWRRGSLAICRSDPLTLALMAADSQADLLGIYKTTDGGADWTDITTVRVDTAWGFGGGQNTHAQAIAIRPNDPQQIIVCGRGMVKTDDGGVSWQITKEDTGIDYTHADMTQLHFSPISGNDEMWICNDGGLYWHWFIDGNTYSVQGNGTTGLACSEIDFFDADRLTRGIGLQDNGTLISTDGAQSWEFIVGGDGADVTIKNALNNDIFFNHGVYSAPHSWRTKRKYYGQPAETLSDSNMAAYMPRLYHSMTTGTLYTHDQYAIYSTDGDGPPNWQVVADNLRAENYSIRSINCSRAQELAFWVLYWRDKNNGNENDEDISVVYHDGSGWIVNTAENVNPNGDPVYCVQPSREWPGEAWAGLISSPGNPKLMHTTNYGASWEDVSGTLADLNVINTIEVMPFNPMTMYVGTDLGVYRTTDGGLTWAPHMQGLPIGRVRKLEFIIDDNHTGTHELQAAIDGRGVWSLDVSAPSVIFVNQANLGSQDGSYYKPYRTVAGAAAAAPPGSIIALWSDDYVEPQLIQDNIYLMTWGGKSYLR